jgi:hypothetical protein
MSRLAKTLVAEFVPEAAVPAVPARLLLLCLLLRSSWLTMEDDRQIGAAGLLHRRGERQPWPCRSSWLVAFHSGSLGGSDLAIHAGGSIPKEQS